MQAYGDIRAAGGSEAVARRGPCAPRRARRPGIDAGRYAGFCAVVLIHTLSTPAGRGPDAEALLVQLSHAAVPFFFIAAGYFLRAGEGRPWPDIWRQARRLGPVYLFWLLLYVVVLDRGLWRLGDPRALAKALLTGYPAYHLWFIPALFCSCAVALALRPRLGWPALFAIAIAGYGLALATGAARPLLMPGLPDLPFSTRNGPFTGLLFVLLGTHAAARPSRPRAGMAALVMGAGAALHVAENAVLSAAGLVAGNGTDFTLGTVAMGWGAFHLSLAVPDRPVTRMLARPGPLTLGLYLVHPLWIMAFQWLLTPATFAGRLTVAAAAIIVTTASVGLLTRLPRARPLLT